MKREIPQKIDTTLISSGKLVSQHFKANSVSMLLRRTRSVSVLGFMITVSALGALTNEQAAHAAVSSTQLKSSAYKSVPLPDLIGSSQYRSSLYRATRGSSTSRESRYQTTTNSTAIFLASKSHSPRSNLYAARPTSMLAAKIAPIEISKESEFADTSVSFTRRELVESPQLLSNELIAPITSENSFESELFNLRGSEDIYELNTSDVLDIILSTSDVLDDIDAQQAIEPNLLAKLPKQYHLNLDEPLHQSKKLELSSDLSETSTPNSLNASTTIKIKSDGSKVPAAVKTDPEKSIAVLPDIDLSQTIIPNDQNSALVDSGAIVHQVKPGETLEDISRLYQVSAKEITKANQISDPGSIGPKTKLRIPAHQSISLSLNTVRESANLSGAKIKEEPETVLRKGKRTKVKKIEDEDVETAQGPLETDLIPPVAILPSQPISSPKLNNKPTTIATRNLLPQVPSLELPPLSSVDRYLPSQMLPGPQKYLWPAKGVLTSGFGWRWGRPHRGIDIAAPVGTPVIAAAPGVVKTAGWNPWGYGKLVEIQHPDGSLTLYAHNNSIKTRVGQSVGQGQQIAEMGSTGRSTGPHTHFELHPAGKGAINPVPLLRRL